MWLYPLPRRHLHLALTTGQIDLRGSMQRAEYKEQNSCEVAGWLNVTLIDPITDTLIIK